MAKNVTDCLLEINLYEQSRQAQLTYVTANRRGRALLEMFERKA